MKVDEPKLSTPAKKPVWFIAIDVLPCIAVYCANIICDFVRCETNINKCYLGQGRRQQSNDELITQQNWNVLNPWMVVLDVLESYFSFQIRLRRYN